ncbi:MAG: DUF4038 domain-containing protein [Bacteroidales bacterium]|nr:DUF4038 domain-containing protein [Bacteroidales bacterium]MCF8350040.1 DUF4038 domain-containing protein [Bacteroidales bacterium]MCF8375196.1 DUF4038 domain-containing protein [Bacteroidales bacterium]MCF8400682.1 DUF4038 domain-containing protein [Bacteroidales bacterium]
MKRRPMKMIKLITLALLVVLLTQGCAFKTAEKDKLSPVLVELKSREGGYQLYVDDQPFFIKGAGLEGGSIEALAEHGGNAMRTWRTDNHFRTGQEILDQAHKRGVKVCMGLEIARERHGFDYNDSVSVREQFEYAKAEVLKYKDHPALLAWGIGNELNLHYTNQKVWNAVNEISEMIHELDPYHPTTTMLAGADHEVVNAVLKRCPSLDFLSFQLYGDIINLPGYLEEGKYDGPFVVSEWGATGHWEVAKTSWGRPIEQTSHEKAMSYKNRYQQVIEPLKGKCLGSFVFLWGQKQERTPTWYGMFLESGEDTESIDVMQFLWTGSWPDNRSPVLNAFLLNGKTAYDNLKLKKGMTYTASVSVTDHENDQLLYRWEIMPEVPKNMQSDGGDFEQRPKSVMMKETKQDQISFAAPNEPGQYRIFVYAFDANNNGATANIPFMVNE